MEWYFWSKQFAIETQYVVGLTLTILSCNWNNGQSHSNENPKNQNFQFNSASQLKNELIFDDLISFESTIYTRWEFLISGYALSHHNLHFDLVFQNYWMLKFKTVDKNKK